MSLALALAVFADRAIAGRTIYRTLLIWPYAIAPAMILPLRERYWIVSRLNAAAINALV